MNVQSSLKAHGWLGLGLAALLYLICLTGSIAVFQEDLQQLEDDGAVRLSSLSEKAAQASLTNALALAIDGQSAAHLYVRFPTEALPRASAGTDLRMFHIDAQGRPVSEERIDWTEFLVFLHRSLSLPELAGAALVGAVGAAMGSIVLTGLLGHPRIFRDAFRLRARDHAVATVDWHNRLGVWTAPFAFSIALTGASLGLAPLALATQEMLGGEKADEVVASLFGKDGDQVSDRRDLANLARALRYMDKAYPEVEVYFATIHNPLTEQQEIEIIGSHQGRLIFGESYKFDPDGRFISAVGHADGELGKQATASVFGLHFGNFAGRLSRWLYLSLGLCLTALCALGPLIWLNKQSRQGIPRPILGACWQAFILGVPTALALTFLIRKVAGPEVPFAAVFWVLTILFVITGGLRTQASKTIPSV